MTHAVEHFVIPGAISAADAPLSRWENLVPVPSKGRDQVYLQPGADFGAYTKVMIAPVELAFSRKRQGDHDGRALADSRVPESQVRRAISEAVDAASNLFAQAWMKGGYGIAQTPGPDVLQVRTGVLNISVATAGSPAAAHAQEADRATFFVEVQDSMSGAILGRAVVERRVDGDPGSWRMPDNDRAGLRRDAECSARPVFAFN